MFLKIKGGLGMIGAVFSTCLLMTSCSQIPLMQAGQVDKENSTEAIAQTEAHASRVSFIPPPGAERSFYTTYVSVPMRDGSELVGNLFLPSHRQPAPTIVSISPYGRHGGQRLGAEYAKAGLNVIFFEARGRGDSTGSFDPFYGDINDTQDVTQWVINQTFSDGQVGMWGSSYGGYNQWMAAAAQAPGLKTIVPGASVFPGWDFPMVLNVGYPYVSIWTGFTKGRNSNFALFNDQAYWREAFTDVLTQGVAFKDIDAFVGFDTDLFDTWVSHPAQGPYWDAINVSPEQFAKIDLPILSTTGLFDGAQIGALRYYEDHMRFGTEEAKSKHYLIIGPYDHEGVAFPRTEVAGLEVPNAGGVIPTQLHAEWYAWHMAGGPKPEFLTHPFMYYVMGEGANEWRGADSLESVPSEDRVFRLSATQADPTKLNKAGLLSNKHTGIEAANYRYDPGDISKAELGNWFAGPFAFHNADVEALDGDGLIFETEPFEVTTEFIGRPSFQAYIGIDTPDADFRLRLYEVQPDGTSIYLTETRARARYRESYREEVLIENDTPQLYEFDVFSFAARRLAQGSKLRFVFDAPNSIYIQRNYNAAKPVADQTPADALVSNVTMVLGGPNGAELTLPLRTVGD